MRQWAYCPRIPFFREALGIQPAMPAWTGQGEHFDQLQHALSRDRRFRGLDAAAMQRCRRVQLRDSKLRMHGIADLILVGPQRLLVCDYKLTAHKVERGARLQLGAYALLAEHKYGVPCAGLVVLTGKPVHVLLAQWSDTLRDEVQAAIAQVHAQLAAGILPASPAGPAQCGICEYLNYCNDRA